MDIQARWYSGWKDVVRTDCKNKQNALCFPSLKDCPYKFPSYSQGGWSAYGSILVFITTEPFESFTLKSAEVEGKDVTPQGFPRIVGCWWKSRMGNEGGYVGMEETGAPWTPRVPFNVPAYSNAIIQIGDYESMPKNVSVNGNVLGILDGWANPYSWPANWAPIAVGSGIGAAALGLASYYATRELKIAVPLALVGTFAGAGLSWLFLQEPPALEAPLKRAPPQAGLEVARMGALAST
jgi:hypothetical protein